MRATDRAIDLRIQRFRTAGNEMAVAAWLLRHRGICPICMGRVTVTSENAVTSRRALRCKGCQWVANVSETAYRGAAHIGLREAVSAALILKQASETARRPRPRRRVKRTAGWQAPKSA